MRRLILLRHAKSSWSDPFQADHDRPDDHGAGDDDNCTGDDGTVTSDDHNHSRSDDGTGDDRHDADDDRGGDHGRDDDDYRSLISAAWARAG